MRLVIGNSTVRASNLGSPLVGGPTGVTISSNGSIPLSQYVTQSGDVAQFSGINPYSDVGGNVSGLPSGQFLYVAEAAATTFNMGIYSSPKATYAYGIF